MREASASHGGSVSPIWCLGTKLKLWRGSEGAISREEHGCSVRRNLRHLDHAGDNLGMRLLSASPGLGGT